MKQTTKLIKDKKFKDKTHELESQLSQRMSELKRKSTLLVQYFNMYKQYKYARYLKYAAQAFDAQKEHYQKGFSVLKNETWKVVLSKDLPALPEIKETVNEPTSAGNTSATAVGASASSGSGSGSGSGGNGGGGAGAGAGAGVGVNVAGSSPAEEDKWQQFTTPDGIVYYHNPRTKETRWNPPPK